MSILENILEYKYVFIVLFSLILVIVILLIVLKPKKVKPIEQTIDDVKEEKNDIEKVIEALEDNKQQRTMTTFEEEQEANAIISYQELVKAVEEKKLQLEPKIKENQENLSPIMESNIDSIVQVDNQIEAENNSTETILAIEEPEMHTEKSQPKFKNSEFISPIFGKDNNNDKFLKDLKDFRNNL